MLRQLTELFQAYQKNQVSNMRLEYYGSIIKSYDYMTFDHAFTIDAKDELKKAIQNSAFIQEFNLNDQFAFELIKEGNSDLLFITMHLGLIDINTNVTDDNGRSLLEYIINEMIERDERGVFIESFIKLFNIILSKYHTPSDNDNEITISIINNPTLYSETVFKFTLLIRALMKVRDIEKGEKLIQYDKAVYFIYEISKSKVSRIFHKGGNSKVMLHNACRIGRGMTGIQPYLLSFALGTKCFKEFEPDKDFFEKAKKKVEESLDLLEVTPLDLEAINAFRTLVPIPNFSLDNSIQIFEDYITGIEAKLPAKVRKKLEEQELIAS